MELFTFRLRFHLHDTDRINCDQEELEILADPEGSQLCLRSGARGTPIKQSPRVAIFGHSYPSQEDAFQAALHAKTALLMWAVRQRLGIDLGGRQPTSVITEYGMRAIESQIGRPIRNDVHGIDVYQAQGLQCFASFGSTVEVGRSQDTFIDQFRDAFLNPPKLTEKQRLACELYCASFFDVSHRSRLITLVTAIETLLQPRLRSDIAQSLVEAMEEMGENSGLDKEEKRVLRSTLQWLKQESIGQAGRALVARLLPGREYEGRPAERVFSHFYDLRSQIVHSGAPHDPDVNVQNEAALCQAIVADLLTASCMSKADEQAPMGN